MDGTQIPRTYDVGSSPRVVESVLDVLRSHLPASWSVDVEMETARPSGGWRPDATVAISAPDGRRTAWLLVDYRSEITPRVAADVGVRMRAYLQQNPEADGLVIAPWGSRRTRDVLRDLGIGFIDSTGNVDLALDEPALVVRVEGAAENPVSRPATPSLRGPKAWALMKTMVEVTPPYGVRDLAGAVGIDPGYTSRMLKALEEERLVFRERRGPVTAVDWRALLTQLTAAYSLLDANETSTWIARGAICDLPATMAASQLETRWAITGSLGASLIAPVAAPAMAVVYGDDPIEIIETLGLLPADSGANVVLARPYDDSAYARGWEADGASYVSVAQLAADCLTGVGRMPAEGAALIEWMGDNEDRWQAPNFDASPIPLR